MHTLANAFWLAAVRDVWLSLERVGEIVCVCCMVEGRGGRGAEGGFMKAVPWRTAWNFNIRV